MFFIGIKILGTWISIVNLNRTPTFLTMKKSFMTVENLQY